MTRHIGGLWVWAAVAALTACSTHGPAASSTTPPTTRAPATYRSVSLPPRTTAVSTSKALPYPASWPQFAREVAGERVVYTGSGSEGAGAARFTTGSSQDQYGLTIERVSGSVAGTSAGYASRRPALTKRPTPSGFPNEVELWVDPGVRRDPAALLVWKSGPGGTCSVLLEPPPSRLEEWTTRMLSAATNFDCAQ